MNRRDSVIALLALGAAAGPFAGFAQQPGKARRILLNAGSPQSRDWFLAGMRDLGWIEGRNIIVIVRVGQEVDEAVLRSELLDRNQPVTQS
jgi:putative tryptophan/tyrosine transport system substrate-binding protein